MTGLLPLETSGIFGSIGALPMHPLVVHLAVIILPLSALALVVLAFVPRWAARYGWLTLAGLAVGTVAAFVAKESGEALAEQIGEPEQHAAFGDLLPPVSVGLLVVAVLWFLANRRSAKSGGGSVLRLVAGTVASVVALATVGLTVAVGHSGAQAVWGDVTATEGGNDSEGETASPASPSPSVSPSSTQSRPSASATSPKPSASASSKPGTYTLADVAKHADASSCWAAINNNVYDLTRWVNQHPGGSRRILALCGRDATADFEKEHGGERRPETTLAGFKIGPLG